MADAATTIFAPQRSSSDALLRGAGAFWFVTALIGQWAFFYYIVAFYGPSALSGDMEIWNRLRALGRTPYVAGDTDGNVVYAIHALGAGIIAFGGALQLIPQIRKYAPAFHRWNGRLFLLTVTGLSLSGFYLVWIRTTSTSPTLADAIAITINGCLILTFAFLTLRYAMARDIEVHQRWAMRLYLVSNAQWFFRVGLFGYFSVSNFVGAAPSDLVARFWTFGCYLVPLAMLELYMRARDGRASFGKIAVASGLIALTLAMGVGILAFGLVSQRLISGAPLALAR